MKKAIYIILLLLLSGNFCFASGIWTINKVTVSPYPVVIGGNPYFVEGTVTGHNLDDILDPHKIEVALFLMNNGRDEKIGSMEYKAEPSPAGEIWSGKCTFSFMHSVDKSLWPEGITPDKELNLEVRLYPADSLDINTALWIHTISVPLIEQGVIIVKPQDPYKPLVLKPLDDDTFPELAERIASVIFWIVSSFAFVMIIVGGFLMVTAGGEPRKITKGRNTIFYALAGFAIASMSKGIVALVQAIMGAKESGG